MSEFARPLVFSSKCLGFDACRYNGVTINSDVVASMRDRVDFVTHCPEVEIGLGVPRQPIRIILEDDRRRLFQPETGKDFTAEMTAYTEKTLDALPEVDGFILKHKSPSCGLDDVKLYKGKDGKSPTQRIGGFFGGRILERFADLPVEDEGRLTNFTIRDRFFTAIYANADFRNARKSGKMRDLIDFHSRYKLLLMACDQSAMRVLGKLVANEAKRSVNELFAEYHPQMMAILNKGPRPNEVINVCMHALGYFKNELKSGEKEHFISLLNGYRQKQLPLSAVTSVLRSWIMRTEEAYLDQQVFWQPYPPELVAISDSGKGRNY